MRRLFLVLDLSLLRQPDEEQRQAVLAQLTVAVGRLWAAYQPGGGGGALRHVSWGYALYDSACPELLLKPKLRDTAKARGEPQGCSLRAGWRASQVWAGGLSGGAPRRPGWRQLLHGLGAQP